MDRRPDFTARYSQRLQFMYRLASLLIIALGIGWGLAFAAMHWWRLAAMEFALAIVGLGSLLLIAKARFAAALLATQVAFLAFAIVFCLLFDVPNANVPRVSQLYLLVLAMVGYINYLHTPSRLQVALIVASVLAFIVLSSTMWSLPFAEPIPDALRVRGAWINVVLAVVMLCGCIYVMQRESAQDSRLFRELRSALWDEEFVLHYQPQVDSGGTTLGAEALIRWQHAKRGLVLPGAFLPAAEQAGLMPRIGGWVLTEACRTLASWAREPRTARLALSINVSADQFLMEDFERLVLDTVQAHGVEPSRLKLELTESMVVGDVAAVARRMEVLQAAGIVLALDDFGTGYSSLGQLRNLPFEELKLDRSFVLGALASPRGATLARNIVQLGHDLGLTVMAEGVETEEQYRFLLGCGCTEFQGRYFGYPMPLGEFEQRVASESLG